MGNWRALLAGLLLGVALGLWALTRLEARPPPPAAPDGGPGPGDAGPPPPPRAALWTVPELDLSLGPVLSEAFTYPVCGAAQAFASPEELDGGVELELGPPGGCAGMVVNGAMHPASLELLSQRSGLLETRHGWLPTSQVPFVSTLLVDGRGGPLRAPLPLVNPRLVHRSAGGTELLLLDDDGVCPLEAPAEPPGLDGGPPAHVLPQALPAGRLLRVRLADGDASVQLGGGWRRTCGE